METTKKSIKILSDLEAQTGEVFARAFSPEIEETMDEAVENDIPIYLVILAICAGLYAAVKSYHFRDDQ